MMKNGQVDILIADSPRCGNLYRALEALASEGAVVRTAPDGAEMLRWAAIHTPDVLVLCRELADMDGFELCRQLRLDPELADVPVVMLAGMEDRQEVLAALQAGVDHILSLSVDEEMLRARVRQVLSTHRVRRLREMRGALQQSRTGKAFSGESPTPPCSTHRTGHGDPRREAISLASRGSHTHFRVAVALVSFLPLLILTFALYIHGSLPERLHTTLIFRALPVIVTLLMGSGFLILMRYPRSIQRMRGFLEQLASGQRPEKIALPNNEDDLRAIESCIRLIIHQAEQRVATIQRQAEALREADRQRVMIESLGTACHHLGQPATSLEMLVTLLERQDTNRDVRALVLQCREACARLRDLIRRMQHITQYRIEAYREDGARTNTRPEENILSLPGS